VFFKKLAGMIPETSIQGFKLAFIGGVNAQLIAAGVFCEYCSCAQQEDEKRNNVFHVCEDFGLQAAKGNIKADYG